MATFDEARRAKASLKGILGRPAWLRGLGIGGSSDAGFSVQVSVGELSDEVRRAVPADHEGVPVYVVVVGPARALPG